MDICDQQYSESHPFMCDLEYGHMGGHQDHHSDFPSIVEWPNIDRVSYDILSAR